MELELTVAISLVAAGVAAGCINTVVGSGSLFTFPILVLFGVPPLVANVSNTVALSAGNAVSVHGYRLEIARLRAIAHPLLLITIAASAVGAIGLLLLPTQAFTAIAPWLILLGAALVALQPILRPKPGTPRRRPMRIAAPITVLTGAYGGYFGAAQGVLIVAMLGALFDETPNGINGVKNLLQTAAGLTATVIFLFAAPLNWWVVLLVGSGSLLGSRVGVLLGRRMPPWVFRAIVVGVGIISVALMLM